MIFLSAQSDLTTIPHESWHAMTGLGELTAYPVGRMVAAKYELVKKFPRLKAIISRRARGGHEGLLSGRRILDLFTQDQAAYPFTIRTMEATTGNPASAASVIMIGPATYSGVTDSTGTYTVPSLIPGSYDIHITKSGYNNYDVYGINCGGPGAGYTAGLIPVGFTPPPPGEPLYIPTTLTITGPANFVPYLPFDVSGKLIPKVQPANLPITNFNIELSFNGTTIGTTKTDSDGNYGYKVAIKERGVFTVTANFAGSGYYLPSSAQLKVSSGIPAGPLRNLLHNLFPGTFPMVALDNNRIVCRRQHRK